MTPTSAYLRTEPLPEHVAHDVLQRILAGEFQSDGLLPSERALQTQYAVSRSVVREAIKILSARGIVTTVNGVGARINHTMRASTIESLLLAFHVHAATLDDILAARVLIEPHVVMLAAQHATPAQIQQLQANCDALFNLPPQPDTTAMAQAYNAINVEFHVGVAAASHNPVFEIVMDVLMGGIWRSEHNANRVFNPERYRVTAHEHQRIVDAIAARDGDAARHAMLVHINDTQQLLHAAGKLALRLHMSE